MANGNTIYFAGVSSEGSTAGDVVFYTFQFDPLGQECSYIAGVGGNSVSGFNTVALVEGSSTSIPAPPIPGDQWRITIAWETGTQNPTLTIGFGLGNVLGTVIGTFQNGVWGWYVLPGTVAQVQGLLNGLSSTFSTEGGGNIGTVWVEESSPGVFQVDFALI